MCCHAETAHGPRRHRNRRWPRVAHRLRRLIPTSVYPLTSSPIVAVQAQQLCERAAAGERKSVVARSSASAVRRCTATCGPWPSRAERAREAEPSPQIGSAQLGGGGQVFGGDTGAEQVGAF